MATNCVVYKNPFDVEKEAASELLTEAVNHFLTSRRRGDMEEEARYFYHTRGLQEFLKAFRDAGGKMENIVVKKVVDRYGELDYYKVYREFKARMKN